MGLTDIISAGLLFWEVVKFHSLVETRFGSNNLHRIYQKNRLLRDLVQCLCPVLATMRTQWRDADKYVDSDSNALDMQEQDE